MLSHRKKNKQIGLRAEKRIMAQLEKIGGFVGQGDDPNGYPDLKATFSISMIQQLDLNFAIECKTVTALSDQRFGMIKIPDCEVLGMSELEQEGIIPILIVELRSKSHGNYSYQVIKWIEVRQQWEKTKPALLTLGFWWIIKHGINLRFWKESLRGSTAWI